MSEPNLIFLFCLHCSVIKKTDNVLDKRMGISTKLSILLFDS